MFKMSVRKAFGAVCSVVVCAAGISFANPSGEAKVSPDEAIQRLMAGNKNFVENRQTSATACDSSARATLATSQKPYAIILSCSDSRVPPEIIFDKGLGELFVVRVAGNIPDPVVIGSIEYAAEHLGSTVIMVLGHERCGAVTASVDAQGKSSGSANIDAIVKEIEPNIAPAVKDCPACKDEKDCAATRKGELVDCVIDSNAKTVANNLLKKSDILKHLVDDKKIKVVAAKYDLDDGKVTLFQ